MSNVQNVHKRVALGIILLLLFCFWPTLSSGKDGSSARDLELKQWRLSVIKENVAALKVEVERLGSLRFSQKDRGAIPAMRSWANSLSQMVNDLLKAYQKINDTQGMQTSQKMATDAARLRIAVSAFSRAGNTLSAQAALRQISSSLDALGPEITIISETRTPVLGREPVTALEPKPLEVAPWLYVAPVSRWKHSDLKALDPWGDSDSDARDLVAVYVKFVKVYDKKDTQFFHFRVDFLDLPIEQNISFYFAIDYKQGGNKKLVRGNGGLVSDIDWDTLVVIDGATKPKVFDTSYTDHPEYFYKFRYEGELDYIEFSIKREAMADSGGSPFFVQAIVTDNVGTKISDKTGRVSTDQTTERAKLVVYFVNMFQGYGPSAIGWYDGFDLDAAQRPGKRRGTKYLLDAVEEYQVPLTTIDLRLELLPGLEYLGINDRLRSLAERGLLDIVDTLSYGYFMPWQPEEVDAVAIEMAKKAREKLGFPLSKVFYPYEAMLKVGDLEAIKEAGYPAIFGLDRYRYWFGWITDWSDPEEVKARIESVRKIHKINGIKVFFDTRSNNYQGFSTTDPRWGRVVWPSPYDMYNGTDGGLHLFWRRVLLDMALDDDQEKFFTIGGDLNLTLMVYQDVAERNMGWLAAHPWIEVTTFSDILNRNWQVIDNGNLDLPPDQPLERYPKSKDENYNAYFWEFYYGANSDGHAPDFIPEGERIEGYYDYVPQLRDEHPIPSGMKMGDDATEGTIVFKTLQNLSNAPDNSLRDLVWLSYFVNISEQTLHESAGGALGGPLLHHNAKLKANYLGHVNKIVAACRWADEVKRGIQASRPQVLSEDLDLDGEEEYVLNNDKVFAIFENDGGRLEYAFAYDPSVGPVQLVAPLAQHFGLMMIVCPNEGACDYRNGETGLRPNWPDAAFVEEGYRDSLFEVEIMPEDHGLTFSSEDGMVTKRFTLNGNTISAHYSTGNSEVKIGFGLVLNMASMYSRNWDRKIMKVDMEDRKGWRCVDGGSATLNFLETKFVSMDSFKDPLGHWLFFPYHTVIAQGSGNFDISLTLSVLD